MRTERFKYVRRFGDRELPVLANCDDSPSKALLIREGWANQPVPFEQLYDLVFDPAEGTNLIPRSSPWRGSRRAAEPARSLDA